MKEMLLVGRGGEGVVLASQGRFSHLSSDETDSIQAHVDERWNLLAGLAAEG